MIEQETYQSPKLVAQQLGVSASGLRRLAAIYEDVYMPLPKDALGGRMWTAQAVARLSDAKALHEAGAVRSIREALERPDAVLAGDAALLPERADAAIMLEQVLAELSNLRQEVAELRAGRELPPQLADNDAIRRAVQAEEMNRYLLGELERRRREAEEQKSSRRWRWPWQRD